MLKKLFALAQNSITFLKTDNRSVKGCETSQTDLSNPESAGCHCASLSTSTGQATCSIPGFGQTFGDPYFFGLSCYNAV